MRVLGIESSCDECAAAVVEDSRRVLGSEVATQVALHAPYGGVVPEIASRDHARRISAVVERALQKAGLRPPELDGLAVTAGPGLLGSLLVGTVAARTLAWSLGLPLVGVNHLEAHLHAIFLERDDVEYPFLGLVVSGGHTSLFQVQGIGRLELLGRTLDDAAGEAFDKVAKLLGLSYPGGVWMEKQARGGDERAIAFPRPMAGKRLDFSFSGLKTAACLEVKRRGAPAGQQLTDFAASFQRAVVETLVKKTVAAAERFGLERVVVAGGVAANTRLRQRLGEETARAGLRVFFPSTAMCTDNAAMVAALGCAYLSAGRRDGPLEIDADAGLGWTS